MTRRPRPTLVIFFLLAFAILAVAAATAGLSIAADEPDPEPRVSLDGVPLAVVETGRPQTILPVAVMIDNYVDARPQSGLDSADLVYELLVEGGITRFMAVYLRQEAERIEPVRSARTPFLYLARELGALVGHVGAAETDGPTDALSQFDEWGVPHLDEQSNPDAFQRDPARRAPHNTITNTHQLRDLAAGLGWESAGPVAPWRFKDDFAPGNETGGTATSIAYGFAWGRPALAEYMAGWEYDPEQNLYRRSTGGIPQIDAVTGRQLTAKNVVVQFDTAEVVNREGHVLYGSVGEGRALIFQDGYVIEATWSKPSREQRTRYVDANGTELRFNRGATWVSILPTGSPLDWN